MWETITKVLDFIVEYGANTFFMALFAVLFLKSQRRNEKLQDARLEDAKKSLKALIEAKFVVSELAKQQEEINRKIDGLSAGDADD